MTTKNTILSIVNIFETGTALGRYDDVAIFKDGPGGKPQVTYGRSQVTEHGGLKELLQLYCNKDGAMYKHMLDFYIPLVGKGSLWDNKKFIYMLEDCGRTDPIMAEAQNEFFEKRYFTPAEMFYLANGFTLPLSLLVIYDSFIHSGSVPMFLRKRFPEKTPKYGGKERAWVESYLHIRHEWLKNHQMGALRTSRYRTHAILDLIEDDNWQLNLPIVSHGVTLE